MLWEPTDPDQALRNRFGFTDLVAMSTWLTDVLGQHWSLRVREVERILLSDRNAIAWVHTDQGTLVAKVCADTTRFTRLGLIADVVAHLAEAGQPVPQPRRADDGATRVVVGSPPGQHEPGVQDDDASASTQDGPHPRLGPGGQCLSVTVQPFMPGALLDVGDATGVRAAGAALARLHLAVVDLPQTGHLRAGDLRHRLRRSARAHARHRAPRAAVQLAEMLTVLPDLDTAPHLVHRDYRSTNVLMAGAQVSAVLDFDEMRLDHRVADLAQAAVLLATRFTTWAPTPGPARAALLAGYDSVHPLSEVEHGWLRASILAMGLSQIPAGADPAGWAASVEDAVRGPRW